MTKSSICLIVFGTLLSFICAENLIAQTTKVDRGLFLLRTNDSVQCLCSGNEFSSQQIICTEKPDSILSFYKVADDTVLTLIHTNLTVHLLVLTINSSSEVLIYFNKYLTPLRPSFSGYYDPNRKHNKVETNLEYEFNILDANHVECLTGDERIIMDWRKEMLKVTPEYRKFETSTNDFRNPKRVKKLFKFMKK
jgi:hypothetical protein